MHLPTLCQGTGHSSLQDAVVDRLLGERILVHGSEVDDDVADQLCAQLLLPADDPHRDVHLSVDRAGRRGSSGSRGGMPSGRTGVGRRSRASVLSRTTRARPT